MNEKLKKSYLATQIRYYREKLNLTQEDLGAKMGYTKQTISSWEQDKHVPGKEDIIKLAKIFSISPNELLCEDVERRRVRNGLESLGIETIPNKFFTYILFLKDNYEHTFQALVCDQDYPTMFKVDECCSIHNDFLSFKKYVL